LSPQFRNYGLLALVLTFIVYYLLVWLGFFSRYWDGVLATSFTLFVLYGIDKGQARLLQEKARNRVPENLLHLMALLGGFIGGWAGMLVFRHKIRKPIFWVVLTISTVLHLGLMLIW
jgi:uncharacterized membrane protein YsdA (DUF1294 family)